MAKDWKDKLGVVFSTNPDFQYEYNEQDEQDTLKPGEQKLYISLDKKKRKGKAVTLIEGFVGTEDDLKSLAKELKTKCGVGGSAKDGEIIIQGDMRSKVIELLSDKGYKTVKKGG
jgi:translation initiation factor 1